MRRILFPALLLGFATVACATATQPGAPVRAARAAQSGQGAIVIREQSNVCVWVHVDQRIWPIPLSENADWNFSGVLAFELGRRYERQGGNLVLRGPNNDPRFAADVNGLNRLCRDDDDIHIAVRYLPRHDGGAFSAEYRIEQGAAARSGSFTRDIAAELRTGQATAPHWIEPVHAAIASDIRSRAQLIFSEIR
jgi:hypothetical protein